MKDQSSLNTLLQKYWLPLCFGVIKLLLHFFTNTNYHLHRDEYLYYDEGQHLAWGFFEVPPITPFLGWLASLLGGSVFSIRLFPALAGTLIVVLACKLVMDLKESRWAVIFTGLALCFSPNILGTNTLFQPVSFNQFFWFLIAYTIVQQIRDTKSSRWYLLGLWIGLAILTKYSVAFYLLAIAMAVPFFKERKLLWTPHFLATIGLALLIALPNLYWQYQHNFPVLEHMRSLRETQLVHIDWWYYSKEQALVHAGFLWVWLLGLIGLFRIARLKAYRSLGLAFLFCVLIVGLLQGKPYYARGAYLILFPFGGIALAHYLKPQWLKYAVLLPMFLISAPFYPLSFPLLKVDQLKTYVSYLSEEYGINHMLRWEDDQYYDLPQDIADMHGWEEMVQRTAELYHSLSPEEQKNCNIYGGSYGHAGAINYFREKYDLPEAYSMNGSYAFWIPEKAKFDHQIMIDDVRQEGSQWFAIMELRDSIQDKNARDPGYIYWRTQAKTDLEQAWTDFVRERKTELGISK